MLLIVNADDLGHSSYRDAGIFSLFRQGRVTSASLLVNGASSVMAAREAVKCGLPLGLHFNVTEGRPCCGDLGLIRSLVDDESRSGQFRGKLGLRESANGIVADHVAAELRCQLERFK